MQKDKVEAAIQGVVSKVLDVSVKVNVEEEFKHLGGDSLDEMDVITIVEVMFPVALPDDYRVTTVRKLAEDVIQADRDKKTNI